jgi:hypothetical protein
LQLFYPTAVRLRKFQNIRTQSYILQDKHTTHHASYILMTTSLVAAAIAQSVWRLALRPADQGSNSGVGEFSFPVQTGPESPLQSALDFSSE